MCSLKFTSRFSPVAAVVILASNLLLLPENIYAVEKFEGEFFSGRGDTEYLQLLDISRRMFSPDHQYQNVAMLYNPSWNGFVEGPTWGAWWIQNSYGPTYCGLPIFDEPLFTFLQNAQDLWFDQMGDGKRIWKRGGKEYVIPDGQLCDAANQQWSIPKQGDGNVAIHDWGIEFTAAGLVMQAELLLISRDEKAISHYLPLLRRCAGFIESRRDPDNNLFLAGPAGNLLAPSYAGWKKTDGSYGKAYLSGLSITYIAGLDRLIELEKMNGNSGNVALYTKRRDRARKGLPLLTTDEGYFIKYLTPDGRKHGVYGAKEHGYFEAVCNHDAICFHVVDHNQSEKIYNKIASIPGLRPHNFIITNCPCLDDMYTPPAGWLWKFGTWVNGGHWSTCEARMIMGYYRLGKYEDARRSMQQLLGFADRFRMDNPLVDFGAAVYQPNQPVNLCYDSFGPPAAMIRGLFEYSYKSESLTLLPHIPPGIKRLEQHFPVRFGDKKLYLSTTGTGPVSQVRINGNSWEQFNDKSVTLPYTETPKEAVIQIALGHARLEGLTSPKSYKKTALPEMQSLRAIPLKKKNFPVISTNKLPLRIGADSQGQSRFIGQISRVQIFNRALKTNEIKALSQNIGKGFSDDESLVGDWTFDIVQNKVCRNPAAKELPARIIGRYRSVDGPRTSAIELSGQGYLEISHHKKLDLSSGCTLSAWICPGKQAAGGGRIIDKSQVGTSNGYLLDTYPGNSLRVITESGALSYDARLKQGAWIFVSATVSPEGGLALYINGRQVAIRKQESGSAIIELEKQVARIRDFYQVLASAGLSGTYEAEHARLIADYHAVTNKRFQMLSEGTLEKLPGKSQYAADKLYLDTISKLCNGLMKAIGSYKTAEDAHKKRIYTIWTRTASQL